MATSRPIKAGDVLIRLRPKLTDASIKPNDWLTVGDVVRASGNESRDDFALQDDFPELRGVELLTDPGNFYFNLISRVIFNCVEWDLKSRSYFKPRRAAIENGTAPGLHVRPAAQPASQPDFRKKLEQDTAETVQSREPPRVNLTEVVSLSHAGMLTIGGGIWYWHHPLDATYRQNLIDRFTVYQQLKPFYDIADGQEGECELPEDFRRTDMASGLVFASKLQHLVRRSNGELYWSWQGSSSKLRVLPQDIIYIHQCLDRVAEARVAALQAQRAQTPDIRGVTPVIAEKAHAVPTASRASEAKAPSEREQTKSAESPPPPNRWNQLDFLPEDARQPVTQVKIEAKPALKLREMLETKIQAKEAPDAKQSRFDLLELDLPAVPIEPMKPTWKPQPKAKPTPTETRAKAILRDVSDIKQPLELVAAYAQIGLEVLDSAYPERNN